jgi:hypothetical protein
LDTLEYIEDGFCSQKKAVLEDYDLVVTRVLAEDGMSLTMMSKAVFHDERDDIVCIQLFQRIERVSIPGEYWLQTRGFDATSVN